MPVNGVTAGHFVRGVTTREQVLLTHGTIGIVLARLAIVIVEQFGIDAHATVMTVTKIVASSYTAETTIGAMVR